MAHPKRRHSASRRDKRRGSLRTITRPYATCSTTGQQHLWHHGYWHEGKLYYKGRVVIETSESA